MPYEFLGRAAPGIGAEGGRREAFAVVEVGGSWVHAEGVADGFWARDLVRAKQDGVTVNGGVCPVPVHVCVGHGKVLEFGHSGLLYHSTPLLYDRTDPLGQERLWDPVTGDAVAGPDGPGTTSLQRLPVFIGHWGDWLADHPGTKILQAPTGGLRERYRRLDYGSYELGKKLLYPARSPEEALGLGPKTPCLVLPVQDEMYAWPMAELSKQVGGSGALTVELQGEPFTLLVKDGPHAVDVQDAAGARVPSLRSMAFGWYSADHAQLGPPLQLGAE